MNKSSILYLAVFPLILLASGCASTPKPKPPIPPLVVNNFIDAEVFMDLCLSFDYWDSTEYGIAKYVFDARKNQTLAYYSVDKLKLNNYVSQQVSKTSKKLAETPPNADEKKTLKLDCKKVSGTAKTTYSQWQEYEKNKARQPVIINQPTPQYTAPRTTYCNGFGNMRYCNSF